MTPRAAALGIVNRIATSKGLCPSVLLGRSRVPLHDQARVMAYVAIRTELGWPYASIGRLFERDRSTIKEVIDTHAARPKAAPDLYEELQDVKRQLRRLAGVELADQFACRLDLKLWQSQFLAIVVAAYPRTLSREKMCELYDAAMEMRAAGRSKGDGVSEMMCRQAVSRVNACFEQRGLGRPFHSRLNIGISLSEDMAPWFAMNFGQPYIALGSVPHAA